MGNYPTVNIITFTGAGNSDPWYGARVLAFTKNTRLQMTPNGFDEFLKKPQEEIAKEIAYMATTIQSALEFVDITFMLQNVSRACAQQITRTRNASYQMQSSRVVDMSEASFHIPESVKNKPVYESRLRDSINAYTKSISQGESLEDSRGILPMNIHCNLVAKYNLRSLVELLRARDSLRVQGEYQEVAKQMKAEVLRIWPWAAPFFVPKDKQSIDLIEEVARELTGEQRTKLAKAADLIKKNS